MMVPIGIAYTLGSFYLNPEIGMGANIANITYDTYYKTDGDHTVGWSSSTMDDFNFTQINKLTFPLMFSFGNEFQLKACSIRLGIKSFYSLNKWGKSYYNNGHYYGFGAVGSVMF